jgi:biopolymer transport protein ExbB
LTAFLAFGTAPATSTLWAQTDPTTVTDPNADPAPQDDPTTPELPKTNAAADEEANYTAHQQVKKYFIDGGWQFMAIVLVTLILGLAIAVERIIMLSLASINTKKLTATLKGQIEAGNIGEAVKLCKSTPGPTAEILGEGLKRVDDGVDAVEKTIVANASVQTGLLEKGLVWLSLFIALAPMLGFMGTVLGMVQAFDAIEKAGDIRPSDVAGGIKVALLTTVFGLIVAMILQVFYNYITSKIDSLVNGMEDATIDLIDVLIDNGHARPKA